jgi:hypothetical protein
VTVAAFQSALARLVIDLDFRRDIAAGKPKRIHALSELERRRLSAVATDRGLDITRKMYVSFRLSRLHASVPRTFALLEQPDLAHELERFLARRRPSTFYYAAEGRALLRYVAGRLRSRAIAHSALRTAMAHDRAELELQTAELERELPPPRRTNTTRAPCSPSIPDARDQPGTVHAYDAALRTHPYHACHELNE